MVRHVRSIGTDAIEARLRRVSARAHFIQGQSGKRLGDSAKGVAVHSIHIRHAMPKCPFDPTPSRLSQFSPKLLVRFDC